MAVVDAEDQLLGVFALELQLAGVSDAWAPSTTAELLAEIGVRTRGSSLGGSGSTRLGLSYWPISCRM